MTTQTAHVRSAAAIRREFIDYFVSRRDHTYAPSSPVVPHDDPTLLFANAGMNQFKDVFLGQGERAYRRAVNTQKCIRAGGKHNDLEDVGRDTYHHTFFEMLGNWSFGDYFKAEGIEWAWELLVEQWGLDPERLYVTVFAGDKVDGLEPDVEAEELWKRHVPAERISRWDRTDNFWEMGDTGPCGPCSEIHYDSRPSQECAKQDGAELVNRDHPAVIEIWNLVFIQFNRSASTEPDTPGKLTPLPAKHVDTGMGFERIVRVLQGKRSNYDTDIWTPIFKAIQQHSGAPRYAGSMDDPVDIAYRVIADHIRCLTIAITDGARPGNEGRSYVLRRILRRAVRHGHQTLNVEGTMLCDLVPAVVDSLGEAFPELTEHAQQVAEIIRAEEEQFLRTLDRGIELFERSAAESKSQSITAEDAFKLHDTYGFPIDLTRVMAEERGMEVDIAGYEILMEQARQRSRQTGDKEETIFLPPEAIARLQHMGVEPTGDADKFHGRPIRSIIRAIWNGTDFDEHADAVGRIEYIGIITEATNFYSEAGGQVGDAGTIHDVDRDNSEFVIVDTQRFGGYTLHIGRLVRGKFDVGEEVQLFVEKDRRQPTMANHSTTHLLNHALRQVLGEEVQQKGSLVASDRLRFDFSFSRAMTDKELNAIERLVNAGIHMDMPVYADTAPLSQAKQINGVRAVFGERYPDPVRVVSIGTPVVDMIADPTNKKWHEYSVEFCGGTHLASTGEARKFILVSEQALAAGVRRIVALTGPAALAADKAGKELEARAFRLGELDGEQLVEQAGEISRSLDELSVGAVSKAKVTAMLESARERVKEINKQSHAKTVADVVEQARTLADNVSGRVVVEQLQNADQETLRAAIDVMKSKRPDAAVMFLTADQDEGKVAIIARVPDELIEQGLKAGDWVREAAKVCDGGGGGRPDMAQAGGKDISKINDAIAQAQQHAETTLTELRS